MSTTPVSSEKNSENFSQLKRLNLSVFEDNFLSKMSDLFRVYASKIALVCFFVCSLVSYDHIARPVYRAKSLLLVQRAENSPIQAMMAKMTANPILNTRKANEYLEKYLFFLNSHEFFMSAAVSLMNRPELMQQLQINLSTRKNGKGMFSRLLYSTIDDVPSEEARLENLSSFLNGAASFKKDGADNISLQVKMRDYHQSVELSNFLAETAVELITNNELRELTEAKDFIAKQLEITAERLEGIDKSVIDFKKKNSIVRADGVGREAIERNTVLKGNLDNAELKVAQNEKLVELLSKEIKSEENVLFKFGASKLGTSEISGPLREQIQNLKFKRMQLLAQGYSEKAAEVSRVNAEMDEVAQQLRQVIQKNGGTEGDFTAAFYDKEGTLKLIESLQLENHFLLASINTLKKAVKDSEKPLESVPEAQQKLQTFHRSGQIEYALLQEMRRRMLEIELEKVALRSKVRVLEKATIAGVVPRLNILPKIIVSIIVTIFSCMLLLLAFDELNQSVKKKSQLEELGINVLGSVPTVSHSLNVGLLRFFPNIFRKSFNVTNVLHPWKNDIESPEVMAFKHIRTAVMKVRGVQGDKKNTLVAILGPRQRDGKSFVACNFALSLAQLKLKTLLIDGDLRKSTVATKLGIQQNTLGLSDVLMKKVSAENAIVKGVMPFLDVVPAGSIIKGMTELLSTGAFAGYLDELRSQYDFVIIDTPPVLPVVDALIVANLVDVVLLTVSHRQTKIKDIEQAVQKYYQVSGKPLFGVYNRVEGLHEYIYIQSREEGMRPVKKSLDIKSEIEKYKRSLKKSHQEI